jgi:hypothetical protein
MRTTLLFPALAAAALLAHGCSSGQPRAPRTPSSVMPGLVSMTAANFLDSDQNRYADRATVLVFLFPNSTRYELPMHAPGEFAFRLEAPDGSLIREWRFDQQQTASAARQLGPGPGYVFELSLLENGTDQLEASEGMLACRFTPEAGTPIGTRAGSPVVIGRVNGRR